VNLKEVYDCPETLRKKQDRKKRKCKYFSTWTNKFPNDKN